MRYLTPNKVHLKRTEELVLINAVKLKHSATNTPAFAGVIKSHSGVSHREKLNVRWDAQTQMLNAFVSYFSHRVPHDEHAGYSQCFCKVGSILIQNGEFDPIFSHQLI